MTIAQRQAYHLRLFLDGIKAAEREGVPEGAAYIGRWTGTAAEVRVVLPVDTEQ